jgi:hypothetical protein
VQPNTRPGDYTLALQGQAQVPFGKDPKMPKTNSLVTRASRPLTLTVLPAPMKK